VGTAKTLMVALSGSNKSLVPVRPRFHVQRLQTLKGNLVPKRQPHLCG
jgi:hypothetical protein